MSEQIVMPEQQYQQIEIDSDYQQAKRVEDSIAQQAEECGFDEDAVFALRLGLEEALVNAIRHGSKGDTSKKVKLRYQVTPRQVDVYITDQGDGFNPCGIPDPTSRENLERPNGRGILLMRAYMNLVEYNKKGNTVHITKLNKTI